MTSRVLLYADPHLGLNRTANTTPTSRAALRQRLADHTLEIIKQADVDMVVCLGDFFDRYQNNEEAISQAWPVFMATDHVMAGNHDISNYRKAPSTLAMLGNIHEQMSGNGSKVLMPSPFQRGGSLLDTHVGIDLISGPTYMPQMYIVPHLYSQAQFDDYVEALIATQSSAILMHCNYATEQASETALTLSREKAGQLVSSRGNRYVISGHEHVPKDDWDGRLVMLGNVHPTSFGDICDKRVAILSQGNRNDLSIEFVPVWSRDEGYAEFAYDCIPDKTRAQFVRIKGDDIPRNKLAEVVGKAHSLWKNSAGLFALKMEVQAKDAQADQSRRESLSDTRDLPAVIDSELQGTSMYPLWRELLGD